MATKAQPNPSKGSEQSDTRAKRDSLKNVMGDEVLISGEHGDYLPRVGTVAAKSNTPIRDIPASVAIVPKAVMIDQGLTMLNQAISNVSGVTQSSSSNYGFNDVYNIRGLRPKFLRDGMPDGPTINGYLRTLSDVERVEVLKGPGSALYGSSEPGGTINLVSRPSFRSTQLTFTQMVGAFNNYNSTLETGGSVSDAVRTRMTLNYLNRGGFRDIGNNTIEVLPQATIGINDQNELTVNYDYRHIEQDADTYGIPFVGTSILNVPLTTKYYTPFSETEQDIHRVALRHNYFPNEDFVLHVNVAGTARNLHLTRNAGVTNNDSMQINRTIRDQTDRSTDFVAQVEPTWIVKTGSVSQAILAGFEYVFGDILTYRRTSNLAPIKDIRNPVIPETSFDSLKWTVSKGNDRHIFVNNLGFYLQDQVALSDQLKVRFGAREDIFGINDKHVQDSLSADRSDPRLSYQAGIVYQPIYELSLYGGYSKGYQSTLTTEGSRTIEPESASQIELGEKASLFDGTLTLNAAYFQIVRSNFQVTINGDPQPVGEQRSKGIELDAAARLTDGISLIGNFSHLDAKLTKMPNDTTLNGKTPNGVPANTGSLWVTYYFPASVLNGFGLGIGATYRDKMFFDQKNTQIIPSYTIGNIGVFYRAERYDVQVNVNNFTDVRYYRNGINSGVLPGEPRNITGMVRLKF